jgi:methionine synthase II (cobalamin-independent)
MSLATTEELREAWQRAVDDIIAQHEEAELDDGIVGGVEELDNDAIVIERTKIRAGKCNSLLSYVHGD